MKREKKSERSKESDPKRHAHRTREDHSRTNRQHQRPKSPLTGSRDDTRDKEGHGKTRRNVEQRKDPVEKAREQQHSAQVVTKENKSLVDFIDNKEELIEQLFITIRGEALQVLIPESLKGISIDELKKMCLEQLKGLPKNIILDIIAGNDPDFKKEPPSSIKTAEKFAKPVGDDKVLSRSKRKFVDTSSAPPDLHTQAKRFAASEAKTESGVSSPASEGGCDALELYASQKEIDSLFQGETVHRSTSGIDKEHREKLDLNERDILELELRARVLRSLLKSQGCTDLEGEKTPKHKKTQGKSSK